MALNNGIGFDEICEKIEIALLSDEELSEAQKKHVESCEKCRVLLERNKALFTHLSSLDYTGIERGVIAAKVMENLPKQKIRTAPKISFTHHLGSVAAIVIICAAALIFKNAPTDVGKDTVKDNTGFAPVVTENKKPLKEHTLGSEEAFGRESGKQSGVKEESLQKAMNDDIVASTVSDNQNVLSVETDDEFENPPVLMFAPPRNNDVQNLYEDDGEQYEVNSNAGGGGGSSAASANREGVLSDKDAKYSAEYKVFDGIEFLSGEENFDYNIALANERLSELYGDDLGKVSRFCLENNGWGGNEFFSATAPIATYKLFVDTKDSAASITE